MILPLVLNVLYVSCVGSVSQCMKKLLLMTMPNGVRSPNKNGVFGLSIVV